MATVNPFPTYQSYAQFEGGTLTGIPGQAEPLANLGNQGKMAGVEITGTPGGQVKLPYPGVYEPWLSTKIQQVFQVGQNLWESITHASINPGIQGGQYVPGGSVVATEEPTGSSGSGSYASPTGQTVSYFSTGPHFDLNFASNVKGPASFYGTAGVDPVSEQISKAVGVISPSVIGAKDSTKDISFTGGASTLQGDLAGITRASLGFILAAAVVFALWSTPLKPVSYGIMVVALFYALTSKNGAQAIATFLKDLRVGG